MGLLLADVVATSAAVAAAPGRKAKATALAELLRRAAPEEVASVVSWLSGELTQRQIGVGWATLKDPPPSRATPEPAADRAVAAGVRSGPGLDCLQVEAALEAIGALAGAGSQTSRKDCVRALLGAATVQEQAFLIALLSGGLRQGALAGLMADAIAEAADLPKAAVKRALTLDGHLPTIAQIALADGLAGLAAIRLQVGRPLSPMLAATAPDVASALAKAAPAAVDAKLDGARVQVHKDGEVVRVFTRTLDDVTARLPEVVALAQALPARTLVLDAEAIALRPDGRPEPFQVTASRFGSARAREVPLSVLVFDVLHLDGEDLLDAPLHERTAALNRLVADEHRVPRTVVGDDPVAAQRALDDALAAGHEGVVVKALADPYAAGRRAAGWLKVKPVHTFDLVVLAAEWGHGRRRGTLSNLHLGARDGDGYAMVGKTFKGLTDAGLAWQTEQLLERETARHGITVEVRPELVVEIAVDGVQTSTRYAAGAALRFARVKRYRPDKTPAEADTLQDVLALRDR